MARNREGFMRRFGLAMSVVSGVSVLSVAALAHHGWGSYDSANPITVAGPIQTVKFENPHAEMTVKGADKVWTVTLAPTFRMTSRGASAEVLAVGKRVSAFGYRSTVGQDEMRAERITVDGKTYELR
jgi:hypothetical protein